MDENEIGGIVVDRAVKVQMTSLFFSVSPCLRVR